MDRNEWICPNCITVDNDNNFSDDVDELNESPQFNVTDFINPHKSVGTAQNNDVYNQLLFYYTRTAGIHFDKAMRAKHYGRTWCLRY